MTFKEKHANLILKAGGNVSSDLNYVLDPGVMITQKTKITTEAYEMLRDLNMNMGHFPHAEFNSRLTYLAFKDEVNQSKDYLNILVNDHGHLSIFNDVHITVLVAGVSVETELEFVAHNEATIARLTSSRTKAQDEPLYCVSSQTEIDYLEKVKAISKENVMEEEMMSKSDVIKKDNTELLNQLNPGCKAVSFTITMSLKDWHKTFIGRMSNQGVELEMRKVCSKILEELRKDYGDILKTEEEYYSMNNSKKY